MEHLDKFDIAILRELQADGRLTNAELAQRVGLSAAPCWRRVRALEESGVSGGRLSATGKGESSPVADNASADGRARNRRVEIIVE